MDTRKINTFINVAKYGSFNRASKYLYISPVAIMQQIKSLENEIGTPLFIRSHSGVTLTPAGKLLVKNGKQIMVLVSKTKKAITNLNCRKPVIKIGTSPINPASQYNWLWEKIEDDFFNYQFNFIPIADNPQSPFEGLGKNYDIIIAPYNLNLIDRKNFLSFPIKKLNFQIALLNSSSLAHRNIITINNLKNMNIWMPPAKVSPVFDSLRKELVNKVHCKIYNTSTVYSVNTFNQLKSKNDCLISLNYPWKIRPDVISIPLKTDLIITSSIVISKNAIPEVQNIFQRLPHLI